jgi:precorrin-2 dehydrogenase / sirohydrochlorin ferrochelatase
VHLCLGGDRAGLKVGAADPVYPVGLIVAGRRCLVVGGGRVAGRKARSLLECRATVTMVAPAVHVALGRLAADGTIADIQGQPIDVQLRPYEPGEAARYRLVVTATGIPEVDGQVASDAEQAGVWVNSADDPANCSFLLPAVHRRGPVNVAVSTSGRSPALAGWLKRRIAGDLGPGLEALASLLEEARRLVHEDGRSTESIDWARLLDGPVPGLLDAGQTEEARQVLLRDLFGVDE